MVNLLTAHHMKYNMVYNNFPKYEKKTTEQFLQTDY